MTPATQPYPDTAAQHVADDVLTLDEASALLRVDRITLGRLIRAGRVPALNVGTGARPVYRLSRQEILACLKPPTTRPPSPASESPVESSAGSCDPTSGSPPPANDGGGSSSQDRDARPSASPRPRRLVVREASR